MSFDIRPRRHDYRPFLTPDEAVELGLIDAEAGDIDARRRALTARRIVIVNRSLQRAIAAKRGGWLKKPSRRKAAA